MARRARSLLLIAACGLALLAFTANAAARTIYVVNESSSVTDEAVGASLPAFQQQIDLDLNPFWDVQAVLKLGPAPVGAWQIVITDSAPCWFCGGIHHWLNGRAEAFVQSGDDWQLSLSHELVEMLVDPYIRDDGDWGRFAKAGKREWLVEVGDPVEDSRWSYERDGVTLSDFVLPAWYRGGSKGPWDFGGFVSSPFQILRGGYAWFIQNGRWVQK